MKNTLLLPALFLAAWLQAQISTPLTNQLLISSNSHVKFEQGNYSLPDEAYKGGLRLNGVHHVVLDGEGVAVQGRGEAGFFLYLENCSHIVIRNFQLASGFFYALLAVNSSHITIENCTFSGNRSDGGGGVWMNTCSNVVLEGNLMQDQHTGATFYYCDSLYVTGNNFSWNEGAGIRMYHTRTSVVADNDLSFCREYAIEASFCDENIFRYNLFNYSNCGLWLGHSAGSVVEGNEISHNTHGVELRGDQYPLVSGNFFFGNQQALLSYGAEKLICAGNVFEKNFRDIRVEGIAAGNVIRGNTFGMSAGPYIENRSPDDLIALQNFFPEMPVPGFLACKLFDRSDEPSSGQILFAPYQALPPMELVTAMPADLCEPPAVWDAYCFVEDGAPTSITWDERDKVAGKASVFMETESVEDVHLHYFPGEYHQARWKIDPAGTIRFWMKIQITAPNNPWGVEDCFVRIGDACGNYFQYQHTPSLLNQAIGQWALFEIPVNGDSSWVRTQEGNPDLDSIQYVELSVDMWKKGCQLWLDSLSLPVLTKGTQHVKVEEMQEPEYFFGPASATSF